MSDAMPTDPAAPPAEHVALLGRVVTPDEAIDDGAVVLAGGRVVWVGPRAAAASASRREVVDAVAAAPQPEPGTLVLPGLVDLHNHGGGGASFNDDRDAEATMVAVREHRRHGTTTMLASLVTADRATLLARVEVLAGLAEDGEVAGIHVEGPFLSHARRGAQSPENLLTGDAGLVRELAEAAGGHLRTMTVAPEVDGVVGGGGAAEALVSAGAIPSLGHTDATAEQAEALLAQVVADLTAAAAGGEPPRRMTATHLFNGMRPLHHRAPGPVAACLAAAARGDLVVELVADDVHLAPATVRSVIATVGADNVALVTDAMAATGMADGSYELGPMAVTVTGGVARLTDPDDPDGGSIAGGTAHLIDVVRRTVAAGVPLADAVRSASWVPARALGLGDVGGLVVGHRADVVVTDADLRVRRVLRDGVPA
ncbi:amidohydrolase family protein [Isoptericola hypogeus]|uniref:Amidohydrolase family protein n=1 Tax=Isoptericola hypogeus TaxID=300179 RepID=A0ABN2IPY8_9MICO